MRSRQDETILQQPYVSMHTVRAVEIVAPSGHLLEDRHMRFAATVIESALLLVVSTNFQAGAQESGRPDIVLVTPNTIRIESLDAPQNGQWVVMPGFTELGSPTFSRDGQWIAFDAYKEGFDNSRAECWIARRDGRELKRLAFGATPRFSPDGKRLLFVREHVNDPTAQEGIYVINRDGSGEKRIGLGRWPDWSPDGNHIAFSLGGEETGGARIGSTICIANSDGADRWKVIEGDCPSWSHDGKKIAYCYHKPGRPPLIPFAVSRSECRPGRLSRRA